MDFDHTRDAVTFGRCTIMVPHPWEPGEAPVCIIAVTDDWVRAEVAVEAGDQDLDAERARLLAFFEFLDANWRGWDGAHTWFDPSSRVGLIATNEDGRITVALQVSPSTLTNGGPWPSDDFLQVSTPLDSAGVQRLIPRLTSLLS